MPLPRMLCTKWLRTWKARKKFFSDVQYRFYGMQTKERHCYSLASVTCHYSKFVSQHRCIASSSQKHIKQEIPSTVNNVHNYSSALYINRTENDRTPVVNVNLNLMERLHDVTELQKNLSARKIEMDIIKLAEDFKYLMKLDLEKNQLEERRRDIADMMSALSKVKVDDNIKRSREILKPKGKRLKEMLKSLNRDYNELENHVMLQSLRLPNILHEDTPLDQAAILQEQTFSNDLSPADEKKNHLKIGQKLNWLKFSDVGPGAYYLMGKLAWLEQDLIYQFSQNMNGIGFLQINCPEIFRTLVVEGCGIDYKSPGKIYTLQNLDVEIEAKVEHLSHFVGVSFMSFAAYLTRMEINSQSLPLRYFTIGKSYRPALSDSVDSGLYEAVQTSKCEACCVCIDKTTADLEFKELVNILWNWYSALGLPIRLVLLPAAGLQLSEMKKIVIEAWAPSLQKYVQVGSVSSTGIYVGQRLMILHSRMNSPPQPVHLVHAELLDVSKLIAFLMEYGNISDDQSPVWPGRNPC